MSVFFWTQCTLYNQTGGRPALMRCCWCCPCMKSYSLQTGPNHRKQTARVDRIPPASRIQRLLSIKSMWHAISTGTDSIVVGDEFNYWHRNDVNQLYLWSYRALQWRMTRTMTNLKGLNALCLTSDVATVTDSRVGRSARLKNNYD